VDLKVTSAVGCGCFAPTMQMHFLPTGGVRVCCWSTEVIGDVRDQSLAEIWNGAARAEVQRRLAGDDFSLGCGGCELQLGTEGRVGSPPAYFDDWRERLAGHESVPRMPARMEFEMSIACNLQCVQCSGANSSAIRIHREKRPPLRSPYGEVFFDELRPFLPHLVEASFVGGEPFLGRENFRVWDDLAEVAPDVECLICTNGTQWNDRVVDVLERLRPTMTLSIDGATKATFEAMRPGADFDVVMTNLDRFCDHAGTVGKQLQINYCLMPGNVHEFPDMLMLAEARGVRVHPVVVRSPKQHSLAALPMGELARITASLDRRAGTLTRDLVINRAVWERELARLHAWLDGATGDEVRTDLQPTVLMFPRSGRPGAPCLGGEVERELSAVAADATVFRLVVDAADRIVTCPQEFADRIGARVDDLVGQSASVLLEHLDRWEVAAEAPDRVDSRMSFSGLEANAVFLPVRDDTGWADEAWMLFAFTAADAVAPAAGRP